MSGTLDPRKAFEQKLIELGKTNPKIVAVSCDSSSGGGLGGFFKAFPGRSVEVGISEQTAVGICAAMSRESLIPVAVAITPFITMRAYEQVRDDVGYMKSNVKLVGSGGGLAYSTLGSTHATLEDVAVMRTVPNLAILAPGDADEVEFALEAAVEHEGPVYIRMPRQARPLPLPTEKRKLRFGKAEVLKEGSDAAIFTCGPSVGEAMAAAKLLEGRGISTAVVNFTTVSPLDADAALAWADKVKLMVALEEHCVEGGLGTEISECLSQNDRRVPFRVYGVPKGSKMTGPYEELLDYYGISGQRVAERIEKDFKKFSGR